MKELTIESKKDVTSGTKHEETKFFSVFRKKSEIILAEANQSIGIESVVKESDLFKNAGNDDVLGFVLKEGSDLTVIDVKDVKNNPRAFFEIAFGKKS